MTSSLPEPNIAKTPIYESLMAARGDLHQVAGPTGGWSLPVVSTDFGAANDILSRLLAQSGSDGQGWVAVILAGGPAAAQLSRQLALQAIQQMQMQAPEPPPAPLAFEAGPSGYQPGYNYRPYADSGTNPAVSNDRIAASMASNMAAGIVRNALQASSPSGFMYDRHAHQPGSHPDPYAASALTPASAYPGALQANPLDSATPLYAAVQAEMHARAQAQLETSGQYAAAPMMGRPDMAPAATYTAVGRPTVEREREEDPADGRFGRLASAMRAFRRR